MGRRESDIPHWVTMRRAISVARSKSFEAPVVICPMKISSAMRPPKSTASISEDSSRSTPNRVLREQLHGYAQRTPSRDYRNLVDGVVLRHEPSHYRVPGFVVRRISLFMFRHHDGSPLSAHHDFVLCEFELSHAHKPLLPRAAKRAASFTRLARSAPDIPGVPRARISAWTS